MEDSSAYDAIAGMYHALWFDWYFPAARPALETLFFAKVPPDARILDVCCGSGHVTKEFLRRGYQVTGVDNSSELVALARSQCPDAEFHVQDVRYLSLPATFNAAISTFDSLNHLLTLADLEKAFKAIRNHLEPNGRFVFDMNLNEAYTIDMKQWSVDIHDNSVGLVRGDYNTTTRRARTELLWFSRAAADPDCWRRRHSIVDQQCYTGSEIISALVDSGFKNIEWSLATELGVTSDLGYGRIFVTAFAAQ